MVGRRLFDTEFLKLVPERPEADAEQLGGRGFVLVGLGQSLLDGGAFDAVVAVLWPIDSIYAIVAMCEPPLCSTPAFLFQP